MLVMRNRKVKELEKFYHLFVWSYATGFAICPILTHDYGIAGPWCWIRESFMGNIWRFACFYIPLFIYLIYVFVVYVVVAAYVRYTFSRINRCAPSPDSSLSLWLLFGWFGWFGGSRGPHGRYRQTQSGHSQTDGQGRLTDTDRHRQTQTDRHEQAHTETWTGT